MTEEGQLSEGLRASLINTALPDEALAEIGRAVAHFALLERTLVRLVQGLLGGDKSEQGERIVHILTSELSFRGLVDLSASLVREGYGDGIADEYKTVLKVVAVAEEERNTLLHSLWGVTSPEAQKPFIRTKYTAKRKKGLMFQREPLGVDDLRASVAKISLAVWDLRCFASKRLDIFTDY